MRKYQPAHLRGAICALRAQETRTDVEPDRSGVGATPKHDLARGRPEFETGRWLPTVHGPGDDERASIEVSAESTLQRGRLGARRGAAPGAMESRADRGSSEEEW